MEINRRTGIGAILGGLFAGPSVIFEGINIFPTSSH